MRLFDSLAHAGWNSFLAIIPIVLAYCIAGLLRQPKKQGRWFINALIAILVLAWLAFLPNTCYLLSEWRHFLPTESFYNLSMSWKEAGNKAAILSILLHTLFYFCYSTFGMLSFALAIRPMARLAQSKGFWAWLLAIPLFLLVSLGVFLGLMRRLNSWEVVTRPDKVWHDIVVLSHNSWDMGFIAAFAIFLLLAFLVTDIWIDGFVQRWRQVVK